MTSVDVDPDTVPRPSLKNLVMTNVGDSLQPWMQACKPQPMHPGEGCKVRHWALHI